MALVLGNYNKPGMHYPKNIMKNIKAHSGFQLEILMKKFEAFFVWFTDLEFHIWLIFQRRCWWHRYILRRKTVIIYYFLKNISAVTDENVK